MNKVGRVAIGLFVAIGLVATGVYFSKHQEWVEIPAARASLVGKLRDPASAQFRNERITQGGTLCGEVNAKNGMGGYIGFKKYIAHGIGADYIEDDGVIGEWSTDDFIAKLDKKNEILERYIRARKEGISVPEYSTRELEELATKQFFEAKWQALCEPIKT
jgi:hypothetical protein